MIDAPDAASATPPARIDGDRASAPTSSARASETLVRHAWPAVLCVALLGGLIARLAATGPLWLDEALTVNFSKLPFTEIPYALRGDGAPPLFYLVLHVWMRVFGSSTWAVRSPALVFGIATLPVVGAIARRAAPRDLGGVAAWASVAILASNPFAIRYSTETRMYSLVALLAASGVLLALRALERPIASRLVPLGLCAAALLYTHYWAMFLLMSTGIVLAARAWRRRARPEEVRAHVLVLGSLVVGSLLFLAWVPAFLYQAAHTGTPWATPASFAAMVDVAAEYTGGLAQGSRILAYVLSTLGFLGVVGRARADGRVELDLKGGGPGRPLLGIMVLTLAIAITLGILSGAAFAGRYTSVVFPLAVVLAGLGVAALGSPSARTVALAVVVILGLTTAIPHQLRYRSQAGILADRIAVEAHDGDVVGYCPDQVGVAVSRLLGTRFAALAFPRGTGPFVNWVDYAQVNEDRSPAQYALDLDRMAGPDHTIWLVSSHDYVTSNRPCGSVESQLLAARPGGRQVMAPMRQFWEHAALFKY